MTIERKSPAARTDCNISRQVFARRIIPWNASSNNAARSSFIGPISANEMRLRLSCLSFSAPAVRRETSPSSMDKSMITSIS